MPTGRARVPAETPQPQAAAVTPPPPPPATASPASPPARLSTAASLITDSAIGQDPNPNARSTAISRDRRDSGASEGRDEDASYLPPDNGGIPEVGEREHIQRALTNMPRDYAIALVLSAAQGVPYQEIAVILGISPNAAATRISRAKRLFMEVYQRFNDEGAGKQER